MKNANQAPNRLRQPNVLPFSDSWKYYLGNPGLDAFRTFRPMVFPAKFEYISKKGRRRQLALRTIVQGD